VALTGTTCSVHGSFTMYRAASSKFHSMLTETFDFSSTWKVSSAVTSPAKPGSGSQLPKPQLPMALRRRMAPAGAPTLVVIENCGASVSLPEKGTAISSCPTQVGTEPTSTRSTRRRPPKSDDRLALLATAPSGISRKS